MWHIFPVNDLKEHTLSSDCLCSPKIVMGDKGVIFVIHNAYDCRERLEELHCINLN